METRETITLDSQAQQRLAVLAHVLAGEISVAEAAAILGRVRSPERRADQPYLTAIMKSRGNRSSDVPSTRAG
jgi:hypothetical protein